MEQMISAGIDIGTSTSQVIFSRLTVENTAGYFAVPSVSIIDKKVIYQSPVYPTPLLEEALIDGKALVKILDKEYKSAGILPDQVETGAVIITGESARKENAALVLEEMSSFAGDFVVATAGPDLEAVIAGQGSGALKYSADHGTVVVNLDIGGGTTNMALFDDGRVKEKGCVDIGGRQVTVDRNGSVNYISPSARRIAEAHRLHLESGEMVSVEVLEQLCRGMCEILEQMLGISEQTELAAEIRTKGSSLFQVSKERPVRFLCFSGGVADCIYEPNRDPFCYGDIGVLLGKAIRESRLFREFRVLDAAQTIRATVIGAGNCTTEISGSTIDYTEGLFPIKNVPVLKLTPEEEDWCWQGDSKALMGKINWFLKQNDAPRMVLAVEGVQDPNYQALKRFAKTVTDALQNTLVDEAPILMVVQEDIGKALGQMMKKELAGTRRLAVVDEICVEQNYFMDFGRPVLHGLVIPVVVKTLIFG